MTQWVLAFVATIVLFVIMKVTKSKQVNDDNSNTKDAVAFVSILLMCLAGSYWFFSDSEAVPTPSYKNTSGGFDRDIEREIVKNINLDVSVGNSPF